MTVFAKLWIIYLSATVFTNAFDGTKFQLAEVIFITLGIVLLIEKSRLSYRTSFVLPTYSWHYLDVAVGLTMVYLVMSGRSITSGMINVYCLTVYIIARLGLIDFSITPEYIISTFKTLTSILLLSALGGVFLYKTGTHFHLDLIEEKYIGGVGWLPRLEAFCTSPNQLFSLAALPVLSLLPNWRARKDHLRDLAIIVAFLLALCTVSKSLPLLMLLVIPALWGPTFWQGPFAKLRIAALGLACVVVLGFAKIIVVTTQQTDRTTILAQSYASNTLLYQNERVEVYASMHLCLTKKAWQAFLSAPWKGIGAHKFQDFLANERQQGQYPADRLLYGPHSLYFGTLAQYGVGGLLGIVVFLSFLAKAVLQLIRCTTGTEHYLWYGIALYLLLWSLESWSMDTINFRHFWWIVALVGVRYASLQQQQLA